MNKIRFFLLSGLLFSLITFLLLYGAVLLFSAPKKTAVSAKNTPKTIVLDCGHGGPDGGAVAADGTCEKDINLALGKQVRELLVQSGFEVVMTRERDTFICDDHSASLREQNVSDLHNRLKIAESYGNALFISLHMNNFSEREYWGSQLFYGPINPESRHLADCIRSRLLSSVQQGNERPLKEMDSSVYIIYRCTKPCLLLECGFMSNADELSRFKTAKYRAQFAFEIMLGIIDYLNENRG